MSKSLYLLAGALFAASCAAQTTTSACSGITLGPNGSLNGFIPSPNDAWHQSIVSAPVDPNSNKIMTTAGDLGARFLHPDFASADYGIPYVVVDSSVLTSVPVPISLYPADSDITLVPIPASLPVEGNPGDCPTDAADRHALIIDKNTCVAYELYQANYCNSQWGASGSTVWDMTTTEKRPYGLSSVDAAGLSIFEGILRYDEILSGSVNHALRFTAAHTKANANNGFFTAPATHAAGTLWGTDNIMGMRVRLKPGFDISSFSPTNQIILKAMKTYGMILADNGSDMFFQGTADSRWDDNDLNALKTIPSSAFDVIQMNPVYDSATAPTGPAPVITSFTTSANNVAPGTPVTLTPVVSNGSYLFIDHAGFTRGPVTVTPAATTTYTLSARNAFGTTNASVTVTVGTSNPGTSSTCLPAGPGSAILCSPGPWSSPASPITFTAGAIAKTGNITAMRGYIDNVAVFTVNNPSASNSQQVTQSINVAKGTHNLVIVGYQSTGGAVTASESVTLVEPAQCAPSSAGAQICTPGGGSAVSSPFTLNAGATADSGYITAIRVYLDDVAQNLFTNPNQSKSFAFSTSQAAAAGGHNMVVVGYQSTGGWVSARMNVTVH